MKKLTSILLILCLSLSLFACSGGELPQTSSALTLTSPAGGTFFCAETGVTYTRRPAQYLPMTLSREPYAVYTTEGGASFSFFSFSEGSEDDYLMLADPDDLYPYYMIAAEDYEMPTLPAMDPHQILICNAESEFFWLTPNVFDQIRTIEVVRKIVAAYEAGKASSLPTPEVPTVCVELIFVSAIYTDYAYTCTYLEYADGTCYVNETETGVCLQIEGGLFDGYRLTEEQT